MGRLRVGVHGGKVIGTTDLRDGRWHHVAVVLDEASGWEFGKNVLLFVNGEPEPLPSRVLGMMDTQVEEAEHGIANHLAFGAWAFASATDCCECKKPNFPKVSP